MPSHVPTSTAVWTRGRNKGMETRPELPKQPHHPVQELLSACSDASTSWRAPAYGPAFWAAQGADIAVPHAKCPLPLGCTTAAALPKSLQKKRLSLQESPPDLFIYHGLLSINTGCFKQKGTDGQLRSQPPAALCEGEDAQTSFAPRAGKRQLPAVPSSATQTQGMRTNSSRNSNSAQNLPTSHSRKAQAVQPPRRAPTGVGPSMQSKYRSSGFAQFQMCAPAQSADRHAAQADCSGARVSLSQCLCRAM